MKPLTMTSIAIVMLMQCNTLSASEEANNEPLHDCYYLEVYESVDFCAITTCQNWEYTDMVTEQYYSDSCYVCKQWTGCPEEVNKFNP
jgi:hypothetical protein